MYPINTQTLYICIEYQYIDSEEPNEPSSRDPPVSMNRYRGLK